MSQTLERGKAIHRQKELNDIRKAVGLPITTDHEELLIFLRELKNHWDADD